MRYILIISYTLILLSSTPLYAESITPSAKHDYVKIGYIPARGAAYKGEPYVNLRAEALTHHENKDIRALYNEIKEISSAGIFDNASELHQPTTYIEISFQNDRVRLSFSGKTQEAKFADYETKWSAFHDKVYKYLVKKIDLKP